MVDYEKIVKGLECCQIESVDCPDGCPYDHEEGETVGRCFQMMARDTLTLIKEQKAKIEELTRHITIDLPRVGYIPNTGKERLERDGF